MCYRPTERDIKETREDYGWGYKHQRGLEKAIRLLEQRCKGMEEKGVGPEQLERMHASLEQTEGRLDVLRMAKEEVDCEHEGQGRTYGGKSRNRCKKKLGWYLGRSRRGLSIFGNEFGDECDRSVRRLFGGRVVYKEIDYSLLYPYVFVALLPPKSHQGLTKTKRDAGLSRKTLLSLGCSSM